MRAISTSLVTLALAAGLAAAPVSADGEVAQQAGEDERARPATRRAARVLGVLADVRDSMRSTRYQHRTYVSERRGVYRWDCSGMADWIITRVSRRARRALYSERPVARTFYRLIERSPTEGHRRGWQEIESIADARPGDVFAWLTSRAIRSQSTGHVGFVLETPRPSPRIRNGWLVRIADATSYPHQRDTRSPTGDGGYGEGTIMFITADGDPTQVIGYGWLGDDYPQYLPTRIRFGRIH